LAPFLAPFLLPFDLPFDGIDFSSCGNNNPVHYVFTVRLRSKNSIIFFHPMPVLVRALRAWLRCSHLVLIFEIL